VFALEAQEGRLFAPLAFTKTYAMAASAGLAVTLVPVLMGYLIRGRIPGEQRNPLNRVLVRLYEPVLAAVLRFPVATLVLAARTRCDAGPLSRLGGEFMPPLDEGDLLYMPSALPGISAAKAAELLQQTDRMIRTCPRSRRSSARPAAPTPRPIRRRWRCSRPRSASSRARMAARHDADKLVEELDRVVQVPGLSNIWVPPIRNRIDMLATGIKSPVGIKVAGPDLAEIDRLAARIEESRRRCPA
jgi:Cu(I)/Ag(I) efflux system membrane protein CusA/SilA